MKYKLVKRQNALVKEEIDLDEVRKYAAIGCTVTQVCENIGIAKTTYYQINKDNPELSEAYAQGKSMGAAKIANTLFQTALNGNVTAMIFYLKCRHGWSERPDLSQPAGPEAIDVTPEEIKEVKMVFEKLL